MIWVLSALLLVMGTVSVLAVANDVHQRKLFINGVYHGITVALERLSDGSGVREKDGLTYRQLNAIFAEPFAKNAELG